MVRLGSSGYMDDGLFSVVFKKLGVVVHHCDHSTWEAREVALQVEANLGCIMRFCLIKNRRKQKNIS